MRRSKTENIGDVIRRYVQAHDIDKKLNEVRLINSWPEVVGLAVANKTRRLIINNRVLFVYVNSSVVKAELQRIRESLPAKLNQKAGENIIDEVVIR